MALNFLNVGQTLKDDRDAFEALESPFSLAPRVDSPVVESPEAFFPGFGIDPFGKQIAVDPTQQEELSWWEQRQLDKDNERNNYQKALEEDSLLSGVMAGNVDSLNELARITGDLAEKASTASEFFTKKYLVDTYEITKDGAALLYDWYETGGTASPTAKLIDALPTPDWSVTVGDSAAKGAVVVSDLPPLTSVEGEVIYNDDGTIYDIIFPDAPTTTQNPVSSFSAGVKEAEQRAVIEEDLNRRSKIGAVAEGVANIASTFAAIDAYENDPNLGTGVGVLHTGASAVAFFTGNQTAQSIASFTGPLYYFYLGTELIKALSYDQDYERQQANIGYKDGKFYTSGSSRADYGYRGGDGEGSTWGESHADISSKYLNEYIDKYNLQVNEDVLNDYLEKNNYIGSNPYYNQLQKGRVGSGQEFFYNVVKSGALMITPETDPSYYMRSQQEILKDFQTTFNNMQNDIAEKSHEDAFGYHNVLFTDKERAERVALESGTVEKLQTQYDYRGNPAGVYTTSQRYVVEEVTHDNGDVMGYRLIVDEGEERLSDVPIIGGPVEIKKDVPDYDTRTRGTKLGVTSEEYRSYKELDFEKAFGMGVEEFANAKAGNQFIADAFEKYNEIIYENEVSYYRTYRGDSAYEKEMRDSAIKSGLSGLFPPMVMFSQEDKLAMKKFMRPEHYDVLFGRK